MNEIKEFENIVNITCKEFNIEKDILLTKSRKMNLSLARQISAVIGIKDAEININKVAKYLNRDRTGMYYYLKNHNDNFDVFKPYREKYISILKKYKRIDLDKKIFISKKEFNLFVKKINVKEYAIADLVITVICGKYVKHFLTSCFNYSNDYEIIRKAFEGYKYKIKTKSI